MSYIHHQVTVVAYEILIYKTYVLSMHYTGIKQL